MPSISAFVCTTVSGLVSKMHAVRFAHGQHLADREGTVFRRLTWGLDQLGAWMAWMACVANPVKVSPSSDGGLRVSGSRNGVSHHSGNWTHPTLRWS